MYHGIPAPLNDRVFSVLLVSGVLAKTAEGGREESLVLQIPVDLASFPEDAITSQNEAKVGKSLVQGEYASVEKVVRVGEESQWVMATASNAKGVLPMWVQKKAVPGEIVKDVEYVYGFIEKHRSELVGESGV
ncbi:hypothetical protein K491DRAFT_624954 [Lophiostoma macrostomum CBS 122681]|uniref:DUF3074 domain-containing protein n=1 Tax=Lophiostoma macrostomum CBS 122681 TaxID=1314788 RepID=A0A6A6TE44_9PLEO|nr:hypothetical protein K491DRAFT_624954 [Lophiostoma macrostomum CBS 122681]